MGELDDAPTAELSIAFSAEELAALITLLRLPPVPGAAAVAMPAETLAAARRSLLARGVLGSLGDDTDAVATAVADLLLIVTAPQVVMEITVADAAGSETRTRRYALTPPAGIETAEEDGVYRFTPFAAVDVLVRLAAGTGLAGQVTAPDGRLPGGGLTVPEDMLRLAASEPDGGRATANLVAAGLSPSDAATLTTVIRDRERVVSVRVRRPVRPGTVEGMDAIWASSSGGLISWPFAPGAVPEGTDPWHRPDQPVTIRPLDIRALLAELAAAISGDPMDGR